jgi:hypothetical protein
MTGRQPMSSTSWAALAEWRCDGSPWIVAGAERADPPAVLICRCGRTSTAHDPTLRGAPHIDTLTGAKLCTGFDPVARMRRVTRWETQHARDDRAGEQP